MIKYKEYLTDAEPEKKKEQSAVGATTPTTTPVLTYEGFIGTGTGSNAYQQGAGVVNSAYNTAINAAETNKQLGINYAQGLKDSIYSAASTNKELGLNYAQGVKDSVYGSAEAARAEADKSTEVARQRGIIDSQSSYQKAIGTYGANAEALGNSGLGASGYGEYLNANAYATHRGQVQDINAQALKANREAAYNESQAKMAADSEYLKNLYSINTEYNNAISGADSEYLKNLYGIETEHNNAMSKAESEKTAGLYELGVGLETARDEAYNSILTAISEGTSLDVAKQSGAWGDLTSEQQNTISKSYYDGGLNYLISAEESADGAYSKSEAESALRGAGYSEADIPIIIASWQESNYKKLSNDSNLTEETVKTAEAEGMITAEQASELKSSSTVSPRKVKHIKDLSYEINGERIGIEKQADSKTLDTLNELYPDSYLIYVELNGNGYIALGGGRWGKTRKRATK